MRVHLYVHLDQDQDSRTDPAHNPICSCTLRVQSRFPLWWNCAWLAWCTRSLHQKVGRPVPIILAHHRQKWNPRLLFPVQTTSERIMRSDHRRYLRQVTTQNAIFWIYVIRPLTDEHIPLRVKRYLLAMVTEDQRPYIRQAKIKHTTVSLPLDGDSRIIAIQPSTPHPSMSWAISCSFVHISA